MAELSRTRPGSDPQQIVSEALELALEEIKGSLVSAYPPNDQEMPSLDDAMNFLRRHTPPE
jgi:hypothetical protein